MAGRNETASRMRGRLHCLSKTFARGSQDLRKSSQDFRKSKQALLLAKHLQRLAKHLPNTCEILAKQHHSAYYHQHHSVRLRRYEDASLAYTASNRHASDTRIGLMDGTVPIEAVVGGSLKF